MQGNDKDIKMYILTIKKIKIKRAERKIVRTMKSKKLSKECPRLIKIEKTM